MSSVAKEYYQQRRSLLSTLLNVPYGEEIIDRVASAILLKNELAIQLKRPRLNKDYAESAFRGLFDLYSRITGISNNFQIDYFEKENVARIKIKDGKKIKPKSKNNQRILLAALSDYLKLNIEKNSDVASTSGQTNREFKDQEEYEKFRGLEEAYRKQLGNITFGYSIEKLQLGLKEASLDVLLREEKDFNFNRKDIKNSFRIGLENCLARVNLIYDFTVEYKVQKGKSDGISHTVHTEFYPVDIKSKALLSAIHSMLEKEVVK